MDNRQSIIKEFFDIIIRCLELVRHASSRVQTFIEQSSQIIQVVVRQLLSSVFRQFSGSWQAVVRQSPFLKQFSGRYQESRRHWSWICKICLARKRTKMKLDFLCILAYMAIFLALLPYPCSHFYFDIKFGDRLYWKENRRAWPLLFWI